MKHQDGGLVGEAEVRRVVAAMVVAADGQRKFARAHGLSQATVSRFLSGGRLTRGAARRLYERYPGLRRPLSDAYLHAPGMTDGHVAPSSAPPEPVAAR